MSKEAAAAILVQTLFTADKSMQNLVMSHAKVGDAKPEHVAKFIVPYYAAMLKAMDAPEGEEQKGDVSAKDENSVAGAKDLKSD
jgi:hypothetical protein